jgi:hypothetical protein
VAAARQVGDLCDPTAILLALEKRGARAPQPTPTIPYVLGVDKGRLYGWRRWSRQQPCDFDGAHVATRCRKSQDGQSAADAGQEQTVRLFGSLVLFWSLALVPVCAGQDQGGWQRITPTRRRPVMSMKWTWAVASTTALPTMTNPNCAQVDSRPSPVPAGTVGLFEGAHYYHCGAYRPEHSCKMQALSLPFCRVCRQVIWNRIAPLAVLQARVRTPIVATARYPEQLDVFAVGADGRTMSNWWNPGMGWAGWFHVQGGIASPGGTGSPVTAIARYSGHLDLFTIGTDNRVYSAWWDVATGWHGWFPLPGITCRTGSTVTVVSRYTDHLDLFTTASDGRIMSCWWDVRTGWSAWFHVMGGIAAAGAPVTAIARYPFHLDLFTVGTDNRVWSTWWDDRSGWAGWFPLGTLQCRPDSTVTAITRFRDQIDLFTTAADGRIMSVWWNYRLGWANWFQVAGGVASPGSPVTAIARYDNHIDLFVIGTDRRVYSTWWHEGQQWAGWFNVSGGVGQQGGQVAALARLSEHIDLFTVGTDGRVWSTWWDIGSGWAGWFPLGVT